MLKQIFVHKMSVSMQTYSPNAQWNVENETNVAFKVFAGSRKESQVFQV